MKVLVAGATGAIGTQLVPRLTAAGHEVVGTTRSEARAEKIRQLGATPAVLDALDPEQVARVVAEAEPEVIVHQLTAIPAVLDMRKMDREFELTNRLRTEGTDHLLAAGRAVGVRRFVAQSFAGWPYAREGAWIKDETEAFDPQPPEAMRPILDAIRYLERAVTEAGWTDGLVLRYGGFYGPGTSFGDDGSFTELVRKRKLPVVGDGAGIWSFIHIVDAAEATAIAVERGAPGIYNIVDDEPSPVAEWLPAVAETLSAKQPRHVPRWLGRVLAGEAATVMMTEVRGASNAKAKRELGWRPRHSSWRQGFAEVAAA